MSCVVTYAKARYWVFLHASYGLLVSSAMPFGRSSPVKARDANGKKVTLAPPDAERAWHDSGSAQLLPYECIDAVRRAAHQDATEAECEAYWREFWFDDMPDFPYRED